MLHYRSLITLSVVTNVVLSLPAPSTAFRKDSLFSCQAVGRQKQAGVVQGICQKEGFSGKRTNQSLRVTAAARILIKHCRTILFAVRKCKRPKDSLHKEVSSIVLGQNNSVDNIY